jgi:hypothetical protein
MLQSKASIPNPHNVRDEGVVLRGTGGLHEEAVAIRALDQEDDHG